MNCPTCGSLVRVHTGREGTSSYEPLVPTLTTILCDIDGATTLYEAVERARDGLALIASTAVRLEVVRRPERS